MKKSALSRRHSDTHVQGQERMRCVQSAQGGQVSWNVGREEEEAGRGLRHVGPPGYAYRTGIHPKR